jgi:hypothetical protein
VPLPIEITDVLNIMGVPSAFALAVGLVKGARALEEDASPTALKYVSGLLKSGDLTNLGRLGATLIPGLFDRMFGKKLLSWVSAVATPHCFLSPSHDFLTSC